MHLQEVYPEPLARESGSGKHPRSNGFAVRETVGGGGFQAVAYGVAVIEDGAESGLTLILGDHGSLRAYGVQD